MSNVTCNYDDGDIIEACKQKKTRVNVRYKELSYDIVKKSELTK